MTPPLITENFLLNSDAAVRLYHEFAAPMPIIDYHCHLPVEQIARDTRFENLTQIWLKGDHYKWRAMRTNGVNERYCTGDASDLEKFQKWAQTVPHTIGNPLYHWTHLELNRPFGINDRLLNPETAEGIWQECNEKLSKSEFSARGIMRQMNVRVVCTTDDPIDSLEHHRKIAADKSFDIQVLPTWRADKAMSLENPKAWSEWVDRLSAIAGMEIGKYDDFLAALNKRHDFFHSCGCRLSDHGIETIFAEECTDVQAKRIFLKLREGRSPNPDEVSLFKSRMLYELGVMDHAKGWVQQFHIGALRNVNSRMFKLLGPDGGFDAIADGEVASKLARLLDRLDRENRLAKTILYNLNSKDNEMMAALAGCFQDGSIHGKIQYGSGWWFLDNEDGMAKQMTALANLGLLSRFVGMLTDSRSFLSYTRHEYFRRILCNYLGQGMTSGRIPNDYSLIGGMVRNICFNNAAEYFKFRISS